MEITKDVIFDTNLFQNETVKLTYTGYLFKANSTEVSIVYGYGDNWENQAEQQMKRTLNGFITDIEIKNFDKFNFCFKNSYNEWDNNNYQDYHADILPPVTPTETDYSQEETEIISINEKATLLEEILGDYTLYYDTKEEFNFQKFVNDIVNEIVADANLAPAYQIETTPTEEAINVAELADFVNNSIEEETKVSFEELEKDCTTALENAIAYIKQELDAEYINDIAEIDASLDSFDAEENLIENAVSEETSLITYESNKFIIAARKLTPLYKAQKRIRLFFYKAFSSIPKLFGIENN